MLRYIILFVVIIYLLRQNIETFNGTIEKIDLGNKSKELKYINNLNKQETIIIDNIPTLGLINNKIKTINYNLIKPYNTFLSNKNNIQSNKIKNMDDKIRMKNIYTIL
tara:strand:- start:172 stop:495 length:324 start_codon:yes stop_codon:yes gene_type:complete